MRREKSNVAPKYAVYRAYASDSSGTNFSTTQADTLPFMAEVLSTSVIEPSKVNAALFAGKWVRYIPSRLGLSPETVLVSVLVEGGTETTDLPITVTTSLNIGVDDDISNWTITVEDETDCTATVVSNNVRIDTLTADTGTLTVVANKAGYDEITKTLTIKKVYDGEDSINVIITPSTISVPCDWAGANMVYTNALSVLKVILGNADDTTNWTFAVQSVSYCTAAIQNDDEVKVSEITQDEGSITVRASKSGFDNIDVIVPVKKLYAGENGTADDYDDVTIGKNGSSELYVKDGGITTDKLEYKEYTGRIYFPGGTDDPTLLGFKNTLGVTLTVARTGAGVYTITASSAVFTFNKTLLINPGFTMDYENPTNQYFCSIRNNNTTVNTVYTFNTSHVAEDPLDGTMLHIMIRVYP